MTYLLRQRRLGTAGIPAVCGLALAGPFGAEAQACAVCYGDPDSALVKGALWGVLLLMGVIVSVLISVASIAGFWIVRARRLGRDGVSGLNASRADASA